MSFEATQAREGSGGLTSICPICLAAGEAILLPSESLGSVSFRALFVGSWMDKRGEGGMGGWMDGWMGKRTDRGGVYVRVRACDIPRPATTIPSQPKTKRNALDLPRQRPHGPPLPAQVARPRRGQEEAAHDDGVDEGESPAFQDAVLPAFGRRLPRVEQQRQEERGRLQRGLGGEGGVEGRLFQAAEAGDARREGLLFFSFFC